MSASKLLLLDHNTGYYSFCTGQYQDCFLHDIAEADPDYLNQLLDECLVKNVIEQQAIRDAIQERLQTIRDQEEDTDE